MVTYLHHSFSLKTKHKSFFFFFNKKKEVETLEVLEPHL